LPTIHLFLVYTGESDKAHQKPLWLLLTGIIASTSAFTLLGFSHVSAYALPAKPYHPGR